MFSSTSIQFYISFSPLTTPESTRQLAIPAPLANCMSVFGRSPNIIIFDFSDSGEVGRAAAPATSNNTSSVDVAPCSGGDDEDGKFLLYLSYLSNWLLMLSLMLLFASSSCWLCVAFFLNASSRWLCVGLFPFLCVLALCRFHEGLTVVSRWVHGGFTVSSRWVQMG